MSTAYAIESITDPLQGWMRADGHFTLRWWERRLFENRNEACVELYTCRLRGLRVELVKITRFAPADVRARRAKGAA